MNEELIKKLQDNKTGWLFLNEEEQKYLKQVNKKGMVENLKYDGDWEENPDGWNWRLGVGANEIFRIKPDYQPEPEYVDLEIVSHACSDRGKQDIQWLGVLSTSPFLPFNFTHLHCLPSLPNFVCFWYENKLDIPSIENVAGIINEDKKVYARFRTAK